MIPNETPYKVLKYLVKISEEKCLPMNYEREALILHLLERNILIKVIEGPNKFCKTKCFERLYIEEIFPLFLKYDSFIKKYQIDNLENYYSVQDFEALVQIENDRIEILNNEFSLQTILTKYFGSSKHRNSDSILSNAIKKITGVVNFPEESKEQQFVSILYPKNETRYIILCENKNRLITPRHDYIEFWYAGGKNIKQLQFIPKPKFPIFYLFDWDFDGLNIYTLIKRNYFSEIAAFLPDKFRSLLVKQEEVKEHRSKWKNKNCFQYLSESEKRIAEILFETDSIIEEQKILINKTNLLMNGIS